MTEKASEGDYKNSCDFCGKAFSNPKSYAGHVAHCSGYPISKRQLKNEYIYEGKSDRQIASDRGFSAGVVKRLRDDYGIEAQKSYEQPELHMPQYLEWAYVEKEMTMKEIAERIDSNQTSVGKALERHGIEARPDASGPGAENYNWNGGSGNYYGPNWNQQRKKRRMYDNYECVVCQMPNEEHKEKYNKALHVHHIQNKEMFRNEDGDLDHEQANTLSNLVTLCYSCHNRWEGIPLRPQTD